MVEEHLGGRGGQRARRASARRRPSPTPRQVRAGTRGAPRPGARTRFAFVLQPEATAIAETKRAGAELARLGIVTTELIVNGILPAEEADRRPSSRSRIAMQERYLARDRAGSCPCPPAASRCSTARCAASPGCGPGAAPRRCPAPPARSSAAVDRGASDGAPTTRPPRSRPCGRRPDRGRSSSPARAASARRRSPAPPRSGRPARATGPCSSRRIPRRTSARSWAKSSRPSRRRSHGVDGLWAARVDAKAAAIAYTDRIIADAVARGRSPQSIAAMREELDSPCTEEMAAFDQFIELASRHTFDVTIFDTAPTGHTMRLLELPIDWSRQLDVKVFASVDGDAADDVAKARFAGVIDMMRDPARSTFAFVMYPEATPIVEASRAIDELASLGIPLGLVVANMVLPEEACRTPFARARRQMQQALPRRHRGTLHGARPRGAAPRRRGHRPRADSASPLRRRPWAWSRFPHSRRHRCFNSNPRSGGSPPPARPPRSMPRGRRDLRAEPRATPEFVRLCSGVGARWERIRSPRPRSAHTRREAGGLPGRGGDEPARARSESDRPSSAAQRAMYRRALRGGLRRGPRPRSGTSAARRRRSSAA